MWLGDSPAQVRSPDLGGGLTPRVNRRKSAWMVKPATRIAKRHKHHENITTGVEPQLAFLVSCHTNVVKLLPRPLRFSRCVEYVALGPPGLQNQTRDVTAEVYRDRKKALP